MISEPTQKTFQLLGRITHKSRWKFRLFRGSIFLFLPRAVSLYLVINGVIFLSLNAPSLSASLLSLSQFFLNSVILNSLLASMGLLGVTMGFIGGTILYRMIFEFAYLFYPIKFRLGPMLLFFTAIGSLSGAFASIKIGLPVVLSHASYCSISLYSLASIIGPTTLFALPLALAISLTCGILFSSKLQPSIKKLTKGLISIFVSEINIALGVNIGYFALEAGIMGIISTFFAVLAYKMTLALYNLSLSSLLIKTSQKLSYYYKDETISLGTLLNLRADDPFIEELRPHYAKIMSLSLTPEFMGSTFLDYGNPANYEQNLNFLAQTPYFRDFIKLGANPVECLRRTNEEKIAENLLDYSDDKGETEEKKQAPSFVVELKSYTLKWQAAKVLAKQESLIRQDTPGDLVAFIQQVKEAIKPPSTVS